MLGIEKHATVMANILQNRFLKRDSTTFLIDILYILGIGWVIALVLPRFSSLISVMIAWFILIAVISSNYLIFAHAGMWIHVVYPVLCLFAVTASVIVFKFFTEEKDKKFLKSTFSSYLAPDIIDEMFDSRVMPTLGGEARTISAFFTDIRGFSSFSEKLTAVQLVGLLNEYLGAMTDILITEKGTLDKYEGDAIIAFFGAPVNLPDHSLRACRVAVAMQEKLAQFRAAWSRERQSADEPDRNAKNLPPEDWTPGAKWPELIHHMRMRIGINTGEIVVGNMGSAIRMDYTMMGDAVNLAARLEQAGKQYGAYTLVSEYTLNSEFMDDNGQKMRVRDQVEVRFLDTIIVRGKSEPVKIYELCAMKGGLSDQENALFGVFEHGMAHYHKMGWDPAIEKFREALEIERIPDGGITPSEVYIQRCQWLKEHPPAAPGGVWNGIWTHQENL